MPIRPIAPFFGPSGALITPAGQTLTYTPDFEADLVQRGLATYTQQPAIPGRRLPLEVEIPSSGWIQFINPTSGGVLSIPQVISFPDFSPSILASFVAGTTASQAGTTVTVTATAHGIVGSNVRNGYRIYYPGSASIPAGWYPGFVWVDANTITFQRAASKTVASESVNGGAAYTALTTICSLVLPGGSMGPYGRVSVRAKRVGDATAASKILRVIGPDGRTYGYWPLTTASWATGSMTFFALGSDTSQATSGSVDGSPGVSEYLYIGAVNFSVDQALSLGGSLSAAGAWLGIDAAEMEVVKR